MPRRSKPARSSQSSRRSVNIADGYESPDHDGNDNGVVYSKPVPTPGRKRNQRHVRMSKRSKYIRSLEAEVQLLRDGLKGGRKTNHDRAEDLDARRPRRRSRSTHRSLPATHLCCRSSRSSLNSRPSRSNHRSVPATHSCCSSSIISLRSNSRRLRKLSRRADVNPRRNEATRKAVRHRDAQRRFVSQSKVFPARKSRNQRPIRPPSPQFSDSSEDEESTTNAPKLLVHKRKKTKSPVYSSASEAEDNVSMTGVSPKLPKRARTLRFADDNNDRNTELLDGRRVKKVYRKSPDPRKAGKKIIHLDDTTETSDTEEVESHPRSRSLSRRAKRPSPPQARRRRAV